MVEYPPEEDTRWTHPTMDSQTPLKSSDQPGTPNVSLVSFRYLDRTIASSLAKDQVRREPLWTLPIDVTNSASNIMAMKTVAAALDPVAWNHTSYIGTLQSSSDGVVIRTSSGSHPVRLLTAASISFTQ